LGIDIGGMGAALLVGYPGTIAATWQQAGRAGRGEDPSLAVLVATADPLDQFLAHHPDYLFGRTPEAALINPDNLLILLDHLRCAAFELPFQAGDSFGRLPAERLQEFLDFLQEQGVLRCGVISDGGPIPSSVRCERLRGSVTLQAWEEPGPSRSAR
jgi:DEAD/DEAH box helicase domain-containing protein